MRFAGWLALVAIGVSAVAVYVWLAAPRAAPVVLDMPGRVERAALPPSEALAAAARPAPTGGSYAGIVVDTAGRPVDGARVLLVRYESGTGVEIPRFRPDGSDFDPVRVPRIGDHHVSGETRTDADGRFSVRAGTPRDEVKMVVAWTPEHAPGYVFTGDPSAEVRVVLSEGGRLRGRVVDPGGQPLAGALVEIFLQQPVSPTRIPAGSTGPVAGPVAASKLAPAATLGDFIGRILGPRVYGTEPTDQTALRLSTGSDGSFSVGPFDDSVQLEVVITHRDYMWADFDEDEQGYVQRPILRPGQVLERTYRMREGHWISGRVVDADPAQTGIPGVVVEVRSIPTYRRHRYYDIKSRVALTGADGSFRVAGLSHAPYTVDLYHAAFGREFRGGVPADTQNLVWVVGSGGGLLGTAVGLSERPPDGRVHLVLERVMEAGSQSTTSRHDAVLSPQGTFLVERIPPGTYRAKIRVGARASQPITVSVEPRSVARVDFPCGGGGSLEARVADSAGRVVDPVEGMLLNVGGPAGAAPVEEVVSRAGVLVVEGVAAGRYVLLLSAQGFMEATSDPFEVLDGVTARVGPIVLQRPAMLRLGSVRDEAGRVQSVPLALEIAEGSQPYRAVHVMHGDLAVRPGLLRVRARDTRGRTFEASLMLSDGEIHVLEVILPER